MNQPFSPPFEPHAIPSPPAPKSGLPWGKLALAVVAGAILMVVLLAVVGMASKSSPSSVASFGKGCIGVIEINGEILPSDTPDSLLSTGQPGSTSLVDLIEEANSRSDVRAILLQVDSPGGSPLASREIYTALKDVKKPKVAYFRELAASGGYYVAMGTDYIVSEPDTLTGSIGVRMSLQDLSGLFAKIGYNETELKSGELKDIGTYSRPMTEQERAILQSIINESFEEFKGVVVENRGARLRHPQFEEILDARVLTGRQALAVGLVDEIGSKKDAIRHTAAMLNETDMDVCPIVSTRGGFISRLFSGALSLPLPKSEGVWHLWY